jgi:hypothetical protein
MGYQAIEAYTKKIPDANLLRRNAERGAILMDLVRGSLPAAPVLFLLFSPYAAQW